MDDPIDSADDDVDDREFWMAVSRFSMASIWGNPEDDVYAQLLHDSPLDGEQSVAAEAPKDSASSGKKGGDIDQAAER